MKSEILTSFTIFLKAKNWKLCIYLSPKTYKACAAWYDVGHTGLEPTLCCEVSVLLVLVHPVKFPSPFSPCHTLVDGASLARSAGPAEGTLARHVRLLWVISENDGPVA